MPRPRSLMRAALFSGSLASVFSTLMLLHRGKQEVNDAAAPMNGPSQWVWGLHAPYANGFSFRHTVIGYAIHHVASIFWAVLFEFARRRRVRNPRVSDEVHRAAATAAAAALVDYTLTPERLRPGFEKRLSRSSLVMVYAAFGAGLAAAALLSRRR